MDLTNREKELCNKMFGATPWLTAAQTAEKMGLSERTVETYLSNIYKKAGVDSKEKLYDVWKGNPQGYDIREGLVEQILSKYDDVYYVSNDEEFYFAAGVAFGHLERLNCRKESKGAFDGIFASLKYTESGVKDAIKRAVKHDPGKLSFEDKIRYMIAGILMYTEQGELDANEKESVFYAGYFASQKIYEKLPD